MVWFPGWHAVQSVSAANLETCVPEWACYVRALTSYFKLILYMRAPLVVCFIPWGILSLTGRLELLI